MSRFVSPRMTACLLLSAVLLPMLPGCTKRIDTSSEDKYYKSYTQAIRKWKREHQERIENLFITPKFDSREDARKYVLPLLAENKAIFEAFGPFSENAAKDHMATELEWERLSIQRIIPNNRKIESAVTQSLDLLLEGELELFTQFKLHREGFEYNKLSGDVNATVPTFPKGFENIFK